jgi:hypothetical protein
MQNFKNRELGTAFADRSDVGMSIEELMRKEKRY